MKYASYVDLMLGRKSTMRKLLIAAVAVAALVGNAEAATEAMNGHRLMQGCSSATSKKALGKTIYCYGYVRGIADGFISTGACLPPQVNTQQLVEVALRYLRDHPEKRHLGSDGVLIPAWGEAWPCAEEKPTFKPTFKPVSEEQTRVYAPDGRSVGTVAPQGEGSLRYYDSRGNSLGTSTTTGNTTRFYDAGGRPTGSATSPGSLAFPRR
jgi:hypothetical protein